MYYSITSGMEAKAKASVITFRVSTKVYSELKSISESTGVSMSDLIRICVQGELPKIKAKYVGTGN